jgi:hypothetical protein
MDPNSTYPTLSALLDAWVADIDHGIDGDRMCSPDCDHVHPDAV